MSLSISRIQLEKMEEWKELKSSMKTEYKSWFVCFIPVTVTVKVRLFCQNVYNTERKSSATLDSVLTKSVSNLASTQTLGVDVPKRRLVKELNQIDQSTQQPKTIQNQKKILIYL